MISMWTSYLGVLWSLLPPNFQKISFNIQNKNFPLTGVQSDIDLNHTRHTPPSYISDMKFCTVLICKHGQARTKAGLKENSFPTNSFCDLLVGILVDPTRSINKINDHRRVDIVDVKSGPAFYLLGPAQRLANSGFHEGQSRLAMMIFQLLQGLSRPQVLPSNETKMTLETWNPWWSIGVI